jgi:Protein of unknown function (DUF1573)
MRNALLALVLLAVAAGAAPAQAWADKMFKEGTSHDFGSVPRGAQLFHRFPMTNIYAVPLQIIDVHSSCGCATVTPSKRTLDPRETISIDVNMDARRFTGAKSIRVNVTVGPEYSSTAELKVSANSRQDVVFNPGQVSFGTVARGETPTQAIDVEYAGALDWRVKGVTTNGAPYNVALEELYRRPGQVGYRVLVTLQADAPVGALKQEVFLQTNDPASQLVPVLVEAAVQAALTVSPEALRLADLKVGQERAAKVMVRGSKPFRILAVEGDGDGVSVALPPGREALGQHALVVKCQAAKPGEFRKELKIKTDLQEAPVTVTVEGAAAP